MVSHYFRSRWYCSPARRLNFGVICCKPTIAR